MFPRDRVARSNFQRAGVRICRKVAHEYVNGYNAVIMATFKSNHDIQVLLGGEGVTDRIYYCCKYVTNPQRQVDSPAAVALAAFKRRNEKEDAGTPSEEQKMQNSRKRVASLAYNLTNRQEVAGPLAALYLLKGSCCYSPATCVNLPLDNILKQLLQKGSYAYSLIGSEVGITGGSDMFRTASSLDDYLYRPSGLEMVNVYEFWMKYFRARRRENTQEESCFQPHHPLSMTHRIGARRKDVVPSVSGPRMPLVDDTTADDVRATRSRVALCLFKPFRTTRDLLDGDEDCDGNWNAAYDKWEPERSTFVRTIMSNMDDYFKGRPKERDENESIGSDNDGESNSSFGESENGDDGWLDACLNAESNADLSETDDYSSDQDTLYDASLMDPSRYPSTAIPDEHVKRILDRFAGEGMLIPKASQVATDFLALGNRTRFEGEYASSPLPLLQKRLQKWVANQETDNAINVPIQAADREKSTEVIELLNNALLKENSCWVPIAPYDLHRDEVKRHATIAHVSRAYTLNRLQHGAFCDIGTSLLRRWKKMEEGKYQHYSAHDFEVELHRDQLRFFLGGPGGTGKSRVIAAIEALCTSWGRRSCLTKTALTGKAATLIGERTLASFLLSLEKGTDPGDGSTIDILVIDEVSMLKKAEWLQLDKLLRRHKRINGVPFGGIHIVVVGDFLQLPPVGADPLYINPRCKTHVSTMDIEAFELWRQIDKAVLLVESVRFRKDPEWGEGCKHARLGNWTRDFVALINSRTIDQVGREHIDMKNAVFVTPESATRSAVNALFCQATAKMLPTNQYPFRISANFKDTLTGLSRQDKAFVMGLPDSKFGRMAPFLDLILGMPIQMTQNVRPAKGAANRSLGTLESVHFDHETKFQLVRDPSSGAVVQVPSKKPLFALLRLYRGPSAIPIQSGLDPELFPVFPTPEGYKKAVISLPLSPDGSKRSLNTKIQQFPFVCAVGSTVYKGQGETLEVMVVVEWRSKVATINKPQQPYLLVSRVVSWEAFITMTPFTEQLARWAKPPKEALDEEQRLQMLSDNTISLYSYT